MEILVKEPIKTDTSTISKLYIDGIFQCNVLEDTIRLTGPKVFGKTAIPAGRYQVIINQSQKFGRLMPLLLNVPGYEGVRIHFGNSDKDSEGCLLLGTYNKNTPNWISDSRIAFNAFFAKLSAAIDMKQKVFITITR